MPVVVPVSTSAPQSLTDATSFDGRVRAVDDPLYGGVRLRVDYAADRALWASPFRCTVYRKDPDGSLHTVRGGDPYLNYAGKGWLYDHEAPLGKPVSYYAVPVAPDGTAGVQSAAASIITSAPAGGMKAPDMWLVNLENPSASVRARGTSTLSGSYNGRSDKQTVLGSPFPAVTPDARSGLSTSIAVLTIGEAEFTAMHELLQQSIVMRKSSLWERPDGYFTVDDVSYAAQSGSTGRGIYVWTLGLTEVARPSTYGQTVAMPMYTFEDYETQYPFFSDVPPIPFSALQGGNMIDEYTSGADNGFSAAFGWSEYNGNTTVLRQQEQAFQGVWSWKLTATAAGQMGAYTLPIYEVDLGRTYTVTAWVFSSLGLFADLQLDWKDGGGNYLASDSLAEWGQTVQLTPGAWTRVQLAAVPVPGAALVTPIVRVTATAAGQTAYYDAVTLEGY
jgi:hypothetical protein